jgi:poly-beta-1,6-N-acetyl-D-glucosamine synthase
MTRDYVLVTTARNEDKLIEKTIRSVVCQTILPRKWVIISDGSTDRTDEIVQGWTKDHPFIVFLRSDGRAERSFGSKARAFELGYEYLRAESFDYIGNLDADVSFPPDYCQRVLQHFDANPRLGVAGGIIHELIGGTFVPQRINLNSVAGAVQMFRRDCYEQVGGYIPLRFGGIDSAAEITARMHGWQVQTFSELEVRHHRRVASGGGRLITTQWRHGLRHYCLGYHPLFEIMRNIDRVRDRPYVVAAVLPTAGYLWGFMSGRRRELPNDVVRYLQTEQMNRLRSMWVKTWLRVGPTRDRPATTP